MGNWVTEIWTRILKDESPITVDGKVTKVSDAAKDFRRRLFTRYADTFAGLAARSMVADSVRSKRADTQTALFARHLALQTLTGIERHEFPEMKLVNGGLIPITSEVDEGADQYTWLEQGVTDEGDKLIANDADDFPLVDINMQLNFGRVYPFGRAFQYTMQDVRKSRFHGVYDVVSDKAAATREALDRNLENLIASGSANTTLRGLFSANAPFPLLAAGNGNWEGSPGTDAANIRADFLQAYNRVHEQSSGVETPDTALFPQSTFTFLSTTPMSTTGDPRFTILEHLKAAYPSIKRWDWVRQNTTDLLLYRNHPSRLRAEVPLPPTPLEIERRGRRFITQMEARFAGIIYKRPESMVRLTGIKS